MSTLFVGIDVSKDHSSAQGLDREDHHTFLISRSAIDNRQKSNFHVYFFLYKTKSKVGANLRDVNTSAVIVRT